MVKIVEALTKRQMKLFATFPINLYKDNKYYVPSFISDDMNLKNGKKNLYKGDSEIRCFLAYKDNKLVGRIAGIICHESNRKHNEKCIRFSRIDFIDDKEVSEALINEIIKWGKERGLEYIHGPWGYNDTDREGMLTFGFDEFSSYATAYSYPYYVEHMERLGFEKESEWQEFRFDMSKPDVRFFQIAEILKKRGRFFNATSVMSTKKVIKKYGDSFFECYNRAYSSLDNFIPLLDTAKKATLKQFGTILNRKFFAIIVEKETDKVVAFCIALPYIGDVLRKAKGKMLFAALPLLHVIRHPKKLELALLGVDPEYRNSGVHALVFNDFGQNYYSNNIEDVFMDPILTTNLKMMNTWKGMDKTLRAKRQTYRKAIHL